MDSARRIAWSILLQIEQDRAAFATNLLDERTADMESRDAGLARELVLGVLRRKAQLDWLIERASGRPTAELDPEVRVALELGAYQLRFLDRIPPHAAVGESVELVKRSQKASAAGLVNAVLRHLPPLPYKWPDEATRWSLPAWLLERWNRAYEPGTAARLGEAFLKQPETWVRMANGGEKPEGLEPGDVPGAYHVTMGRPPQGARRQDISSQAVVPLLAVQPGDTVLDVCAAPGNKTAQMLEVPGVTVIACDNSRRRLLDLNAPGSLLVEADAERPLPFGPIFDRILVDAPCSGTGTLGRNPEIRWRVDQEDVKRHHNRQVLILKHSLACLKPGGRLVYSTCSLQPEENWYVVDEVAPNRVKETMQRLPGKDSGDGFWAAVLSFD